MNKPNGTDLYSQRVEIITKIVQHVDNLKIESDRLRHLRSQGLKQGRIVGDLRRELNKAEEELSRLYKRKK